MASVIGAVADQLSGSGRILKLGVNDREVKFRMKLRERPHQADFGIRDNLGQIAFKVFGVNIDLIGECNRAEPDAVIVEEVVDIFQPADKHF